jgi:hypothetical protein
MHLTLSPSFGYLLVMINKLTPDQCATAIRNGEFGDDVIKATTSAVVVLTQSWCPQWIRMREYLDRLPEDSTRRISYVEYDLEPYFEDFMSFKETKFGNDQVPYVRYYRKGSLARESNYVDERGFIQLAGK